MDLIYAWEKLHLAVDGMARSPLSLQHRIANAYAFHLINFTSSFIYDRLPDYLTPLFDDIIAAMTAVEDHQGQGQALSSALAMTDDEAGEIASKIVSLYDSVRARLPAE